MHKVIIAIKNDILASKTESAIKSILAPSESTSLDPSKLDLSTIIDINPDFLITEYHPDLDKLHDNLMQNGLTQKICKITIVDPSQAIDPPNVEFTLNKPVNSTIIGQIIKSVSNQKSQESELNRLSEIFLYDYYQINANRKIIKAKFMNNSFNAIQLDLADQEIDQVLPESFIEIFHEKIEQVHLLKKSINFQIPHKSEQEEIWYLVHMTPHKQNHTSIIISDITKHKRHSLIQDVLFDIAKAVSTSDNMQELYSIIHKSLNKIVDARNFYIAFRDEKDGSISSPYFTDEKEDNILPKKLGKKGISNHVIKSKKALYIDDAIRAQLFSTGLVDSYQSTSKTMLGVPLIVDEIAIGMIAVRSHSQDTIYTDHHLDVLEFISNLIATAISQKRAEKEIQQSVIEKDLLLKELYHRTKNNMQVIISMLSIQAKSSSNPNLIAKLNDITNRIATMSLAQDKLYISKNLSQISLKDYINDLTNLLIRNNYRRALSIGKTLNIIDTNISIDTALPLGLAINELVSNSYKYSFTNERSGKISICLQRCSDNKMVLQYSDTGNFPVDEKSLNNQKSMGLQNFYAIIKYQLKGTAKYQIENGLNWEIIFQESLYEDRI